MRDFLRPYRNELIISTKAGYDMWDGPYGNWGSRKYLIASLDESLKRMQLDYVDIFYHHRMDPETPLEETILALDQIVRSGKALYAGISNYDGVHAKKALEIAKEIHLPLIINQNRYNIFDRTVENNDLKAYARESGMGLICFSPLAQGMLSENILTASRLTAVLQEMDDSFMQKILLRKRLKRSKSWMLLQKREGRAFHRWHFPGC